MKAFLAASLNPRPENYLCHVFLMWLSLPVPLIRNSVQNCRDQRGTYWLPSSSFILDSFSFLGPALYHIVDISTFIILLPLYLGHNES